MIRNEGRKAGGQNLGAGGSCSYECVSRPSPSDLLGVGSKKASSKTLSTAPAAVDGPAAVG
eukprot:scaffold92125_cov49-Prasinocladus_malaysianus.AAC.2